MSRLYMSTCVAVALLLLDPKIVGEFVVAVLVSRINRTWFKK